jgi:catechol 2,3-dioxygenase-like lactoylglutathione lyase family enzyme
MIDGLTPFHAGYMVPDLDQAVESFGAALGLEFMKPQELEAEADFLGGTMKWHNRFTYSIGEGFRYELVEPVDRAGWQTIPGGPFIHHVGNWVDEYAPVERRLLAAGFVKVLGPTGDAPGGFGYFQDPNGSVTIEICERIALQPLLEGWFGPI